MSINKHISNLSFRCVVYKIRKILFGFTLACSDVRCQRIELEISYLVNIEIFTSLLNCLYI